MKNIFLVFYIFGALFYLNSDDLNASLDYKTISDKFYPRDEGSENEKNLIDYIKDFCESNQITYKLKKIDDEKNYITNSYNLEVYFKGSSKIKEQLIVVCPLNSYINNQEFYDNSISVKIMLDLMLLVKMMPFKKDIIFLFTGANERDNSNFDGVKYFLSDLDNANRSLAIVIDILSNKTKILLTGSSNRKPIPLVLLKNYFNIDKGNLNIDFNRREIYTSRFFLLPHDNYESAFIDSGIPCVRFSNKTSTISNVTIFDNLYQGKLTNYFFKWLLSGDNINLPLDADYHYHYINFFGIKIIISETVQIVIIVITIFILIIAWFYFSMKRRIHFSLFIKSFPYFIILFIINLILSFLPLILFLPISFITGTSRSYLNFPIIYFFNIFFIPLFLILISFEIIKKIPFPKHTNLFIYGASIFILANMVLFIIFDISIAYVYLWSMIFLSLSNYTGSNRSLKYLLYFLSTVPFLILIYDISFFRNLDTIKNLNPILINFFFMILSFPFTLLFLGFNVFLKIIHKIFLKNIHYLTIIIFIVLFTIISSMIVSGVRSPEKKVINANLLTEVQSRKSNLELSSNANIGNITVNNNNNSAHYDIFSSAKKINAAFTPKPYELIFTKNDSFFNYNLLINSNYPIEYINAYLITPKEAFPAESNYIFTKEIKSKSNTAKYDTYKFLIPRNIGENFNLKISLLNQKYSLIVEIIYPFLIEESKISLTKANGIINSTTEFIERFEIQNN